MKKIVLVKLLLSVAFVLMIIGSIFTAIAPKNIFIGIGFYIASIIVTFVSIFPLIKHIKEKRQ